MIKSLLIATRDKKKVINIWDSSYQVSQNHFCGKADLVLLHLATQVCSYVAFRNRSANSGICWERVTLGYKKGQHSCSAQQSKMRSSEINMWRAFPPCLSYPHARPPGPPWWTPSPGCVPSEPHSAGGPCRAGEEIKASLFSKSKAAGQALLTTYSG